MDQDPNMAKILNVETMPSFIFLQHGERVSSFVGANEKILKKGLEKAGKISKLGILRR
jgi:thioredoxin-like negative regulator of GroEL